MTRLQRTRAGGGASSTLLRRAGLALVLVGLARVQPVRAEDGEHCSDPGFRDSYACRQVIVRYGPGFDLGRLLRRHPELSVIGLIPQLSQAWIEAPRGTDVPALIRQLTSPAPAGEPGVRSAERNGEYASPECRQLNAPILDVRGATPATLAMQPALGAMRASPDRAFGAGVVVAVLDTGIARAHPALAGGRILPGVDLVSGGDAGDRGDGIDQDGNGIVDDGYGHGTAVAGLIHLVAPGAILLPVRVLDDECRGTAFTLAAGVVQAVDRGARILNASLGAREGNAAVGDALAYAAARGAVIIAAAGNARPSGADGGEVEDENELEFPASHPAAVAVAALDSAYVAAPHTIHGRRVALSAPGVDVLAPWRNGYGLMTGTSFATAFVSGAAATGLGRHPAIGRAGLVRLMRATAIPVDLWNPGLEGTLGSGVPSVAVLAGQAPAPPTPSTPTRSHPEGDEGD